jgi:TolB-like protein
MGFFAEVKRRNVVRVAGVYIVVGWILVQVATALEETLGLPSWFDGTIVALLLIGLPIALIFAWAFELTPEGVVRTESVPEGESITSETGRKLDFALSIAIIALIIVIVWQSSIAPDAIVSETVVVAHDDAAPSDASVAVLPFADMSAAGDQEYFSDGLTEEILNLLVRANELEVVSRTSSFQFKDTTLGIPEIAAELNVRHVVEGSVRKAGNTIRVTAQLIDALTDRHLWSETYDRPLTTENLFEIQDDVANSIFEALGEELGLLGEIDLRAKRTTSNLDAYELFLRARALFEGRLELDTADDLLDKATALDPGFAEAWAYRAATQFLMFDYGYSDLSIRTLHERGLEFAEKALVSDPDNATAIAAIANIRTQQTTLASASYDWSETIALFTRALEIDPLNPSALNWRGLTYDLVGDIESALADFRRCVKVEPYYTPCRENLHWFLADTGEDDAAMSVLRESQNNGVSKSLYLHLALLARTGNELLFKAATNDERALRGWRHHDELYKAFLNLDADHSALAQSIVEFFEANPGRDEVFVGAALLPLGYAPSIAQGYSLYTDSAKKYRQTPQFREWVTKIGVVDYWQQHGYPDVCRPLGDDDFECD